MKSTYTSSIIKKNVFQNILQKIWKTFQYLSSNNEICHLLLMSFNGAIQFGHVESESNNGENV